jgi:uncharacterized protein GlcG (DUF336 family)
MRRAPGVMLSLLALLLNACGGGGSSASPTPPTPATGGGNTGGGTSTPQIVYTPPPQVALSTGDVQQVIAQAVAQARADRKPAVISVVDRVGNVLALFRMNGAPATAHISDAPNGRNVDAQGLDVPAEAAAIAKAITGAYLSSGGNAFSSRTASGIVQAQFPLQRGTVGLGSGPLFGVQFSQLPCSDFASRFGASGAAAMIGPKRSPLGLAADPGGFPLYKNGVLVGGVGVEADGAYAFDPDVDGRNLLTDERVALAGTVGFDAPDAIRADRITVAGTLLSYSNVAAKELASLATASFQSAQADGVLEALTGYTAGAILAGAAYGSEASGVRAATGAEFANPNAFIFTDGTGANRFPIRAGSDGAEVGTALSSAEVEAILAKAFGVMSRARAQIRNPLNSLAQVSITVVDTRGRILGVVRAPDAPVFGADVSVQKARTAAFFSGAFAAADLSANPSSRVQAYVGALRAFLEDPAALTGRHAFTDRANGNLARPTFPDGTVGSPPGPLSVPADQFNPFTTGLQSALIVGNLAQHLAFATGAAAADTPQRCTTNPDIAGQNRTANGIQIFPGSVPIYRGSTLIGGLGVSGDGIDQDDMISFLGLDQAGKAVGGIGNAPAEIRTDRIVIRLPNGTSARLRYVSCPQAPFVDSNDQTPCEGL